MTPTIVVWTKPRCVQCTAVKRHLSGAAVRFEEADLTAPENADLLEGFISAGYSSAPITTFGGTTIAGYDPDALNALVERYREKAA